MNTLNKVIDVSVVLIAMYLLATNAYAFNQLIGGAGSLFTSSVRTLQGR